MKPLKHIPDPLAPCGVYCKACPAYQETCLGCASNNKDQKRKSKFTCKIRLCAYEHKMKNFCSECKEFPCKVFKKKLFFKHEGDPAFQYRFDVFENFRLLKEMKIDDYLEYQDKRWRCPKCGGRVFFYSYRCKDCGADFYI